MSAGLVGSRSGLVRWRLYSLEGVDRYKKEKNDAEETLNRIKKLHKVTLIDIELIQVGLFAAGWVDLGQRSPENVKGSKMAWRATLFLNGIGPLAYLIKGRKRSNWMERDILGKLAVYQRYY